MFSSLLDSHYAIGNGDFRTDGNDGHDPVFHSDLVCRRLGGHIGYIFAAGQGVLQCGDVPGLVGDERGVLQNGDQQSCRCRRDAAG